MTPGTYNNLGRRYPPK